MSREMKHSGIEWIGEIPKEWKVLPLKWILRKPLQYGANESGYPFDESLPRYVRITDILNNNLREDIQKQSLTEEQANGYILEKNDILFARSGGTVGKTFLYSSKYGRCAFAGYLIRAQINSQNDSCFIYYYTLSAAYDEWKKQIFIQATIQNIGADRYSLLEIPLPPLSEQQKIANYLDKVCGEVDEMITLQEQMIEELKAYKQSVITEAVTKGLNPDVPMKDSASREQNHACMNYAEAQPVFERKFKDRGIDWIGEVPEGWTICRVKNIASLYGRIGFRGYTSDDLNKDGEGAITLSPSNMIPMGMDYSKVTYLSWKKYEESPEIMIQNDDLLMVKTGSSYGKVSYVDNLPKEATINPQILRIVPSINSKYLGYYMQTNLFTYQVEGGVVGGTIPTISQEKINNFYVFLPNDEEQQSIASYLDTKCAEIDALIDLKQAKIEELKDYKKSVIYEYVTGKKEVV